MADSFAVISQVFRDAGDVLASVGQTLAGLVDVLLQTFRRTAAVKWAETARPELVRIMRRTKKRRTRKKYMDRIMREYLRWVTT